MQRIPPLTVENAPEASKPILENIKSRLGRIPNIYATAAHSPAALKGLTTLTSALAGGKLEGIPSEAVSLCVSQEHGCHYCTAAHTALAKRQGATDEQALGYRQGKADDPKIQALLDFATAVVKNRGQVSDDDVQKAKDAGFAEADLLEAIGIVVLNTFTNYINALVKTDLDFPKVPKVE